MPRKRKAAAHENHERWLVSYADFITLLFAFFVVMYAISSVNEGKYRVLSDSLSVGFRGSIRTLEPLQIGRLMRERKPLVKTEDGAHQPRRSKQEKLSEETSNDNCSLFSTPILLSEEDEGVSAESVEIEIERAKLEKIYQKIIKQGSGLLDEKKMSIRKGLDWIEIELNPRALFDSARADINKGSLTLLDQVSELIGQFSNPVVIEGHADDRPIKSSLYPSNWELSAARAARVVNHFVSLGLDPARLSAIGFGEFRPIASNESELGREKNRRVLVVIYSPLKGVGRRNSTLSGVTSGNSAKADATLPW